MPASAWRDPGCCDGSAAGLSAAAPAAGSGAAAASPGPSAPPAADPGSGRHPTPRFCIVGNEPLRATIKEICGWSSQDSATILRALMAAADQGGWLPPRLPLFCLVENYHGGCSHTAMKEGFQVGKRHSTTPHTSHDTQHKGARRLVGASDPRDLLFFSGDCRRPDFEPGASWLAGSCPHWVTRRTAGGQRQVEGPL